MNHGFPFFKFERTLFRLYKLLVFRRKLKSFSSSAYISPYATILGIEHLSVDDGAVISRDCSIMAISAHGGQRFRPEITVGKRSYLGRGCVISAAGKIRLGDDVVIGDNVYLGCAQHGHEANGISVFDQPLIVGDIEIADRAWIGYGSFVNARGLLTIGEHSIISANSVVTKSIPPYTMVGGVPAKPIKRYDFKTMAWRRADEDF